DLSRVRVVVLDPSPLGVRSESLRVPARIADMIVHRDHVRRIRRQKPDVFINNTMGSWLPCPISHGIYMCMFPHEMMPAQPESTILRRAYRSAMDVTERAMGYRPCDAISSYAVVTANSEYTRHWVDRRWNVESEVVYTVCEDMGPAKPKEKIIL